MRPPVAMPLPATMMPGPAVSFRLLESSTVRESLNCRGANGAAPPATTRASAGSCSSVWAA